MLIVDKMVGILGTEIAEKYKNKLGKKKVCICGKLDPMAQGKLLLLFDEECKKMDERREEEKQSFSTFCNKDSHVFIWGKIMD